MKWVMPETTGKKRWEVAPCIITLDADEKAEDTIVAIVKAAIEEATPGGLGLITAFFHEASEEELFSKEAIKEIRTEIKKRKMVKIDYWAGRAVKLFLKVIGRKTLHISLNTWTDRLPRCPQNIPKEAIDDLQNVLEIASGKKSSTSNQKDRLLKGFAENDMGPMVLQALTEKIGFPGTKKQSKLRSNIEKSRAGSTTKNRYIEDLARKVMAKYGCARERLRISMYALSWLPEMVERKDWEATVTQIILPDERKLPGFTIDNQLNIIKGAL